MKNIKGKLVALSLVFMLVLTFSAEACTGVYVGKDVSASGATVIARTRDSNNFLCVARRLVVPRVENVPERVYREINGFEMALSETTFRYVSGALATASGRGTFGASTLNEKGVAVTATVTAHTRVEASEADPFVETGISEACIGDIIALNCATARESVDFLGNVIREHGNAEPSVIMVADQDEAWYIETYTGHQWAAVRMPSDKAAVFGNQFALDPLHEAYEEIVTSEGIESAMQQAGAAMYDESGRFDLFNTYIGTAVQTDYSNRRTWYGQYCFSADAPEYDTDTQYSLFFAPKGKISVADIEELYRSRFEGTEFCPDENGRNDMRIIGTETQYSVDITEVHHDLPRPMSLVSWVCLDNAEHSVFLPFSNLITETDEAWSRDMTEALPYEDDSIAFYAFQNLCALSVTGRDAYGQGVRAYWRAVEDHLLETYPNILQRTKALYDNSPSEAEQFITDYSKMLQCQAVSDAKHMKNEILHYLALNQRTFDVQSVTEALVYDEPYIHEPYQTDLLPDIAGSYSYEE